MGRLRSHGDILGFHMNNAADVTVFHHWQGVQRTMSGGGRHLAVSRSVGSENVSFVVVEMASRNADGLRFRSNRLDPDLANFFTPPPLDDRIVLEVPRDPDFTHAGGIRLLGNFLAVPVERGATVVPGNPPVVVDPGASKVLFYDLSDPLFPERLSVELESTRSPATPSMPSATPGEAAALRSRFLEEISLGNRRVGALRIPEARQNPVSGANNVGNVLDTSTPSSRALRRREPVGRKELLGSLPEGKAAPPLHAR